MRDLLINNWKKVLGVVILLAGLPLAIYLATHPQIFKPKASDEVVGHLEVSNKAKDGDVQVEGDTPTIRVESGTFDVSYNP